MIISLETVKRIAQELEADLREYRLSGDLVDLQHILQGAMNIIETPDTTLFVKDLTYNEKIALEEIMKCTADGSNISITKLTQATNLSRPVFDSLLRKMEKFGIANIKSCGVKGTQIDWKVKP